jgi:hypothetical protein
MQSRSRVPEEPLGRTRPRPFITAGAVDAELAAIALLCLVFAWPAEEREQPRPRSDSP